MARTALKHAPVRTPVRPMRCRNASIHVQKLRPCGGRRIGQSLLELVAATVIIAIALVPLLRLTRSGILGSARVEQSELCLALCVSELETAMALTMAQWTMGTTTGDFNAIGRPNFKFSVTTSDAATDGGIPDLLAAITVLVWQDQDDDNVAGANEPQSRLQTKVSSSVSYQHEAGTHGH